MIQEDRQLLLTDLCARLPYDVKIDREWIAPMTGSPEHTIDEFNTFDVEILSSWLDEEGGGLTICDDGMYHWVRKYSCKPYLRPMSSMTEEELRELLEIDKKRGIFSSRHLTWHLDGEVIDYLNKKMLDWRGLIPMGLALEAPEDMYNI